ncbi:MAG: hypothetical protein MPJ24_09850 [Pirellulaceae bacterium]|nr:hypothetical protein [Pirellulaceae bacterium]
MIRTSLLLPSYFFVFSCASLCTPLLGDLNSLQGAPQQVESSPDELWLVNSRNAVYSEEDQKHYQTFRYQEGQWQEVPAQELFEAFAENPDYSNACFVHGNRYDLGWAQSRGLLSFEKLTTTKERKPLRYIVWAWRSDRVRGALRDVRYKASLADEEATHFASFLKKLPEGTKLTCLAHSYGARVASAAAHLLRIPDHKHHHKDPENRSFPKISLVLFAAALHDNAFEQGEEHHQTVYASEKIISFFNSCDPALKRYGLTERRCRPTALGYTGIRSNHPPKNYYEEDIAGLIGQEHSDLAYFKSEPFLDKVRNLLWN